MALASNKAAFANVSALIAFKSMDLPRRLEWWFNLIDARQSRRDAIVNGVVRKKKAARALPEAPLLAGPELKSIQKQKSKVKIT